MELVDVAAPSADEDKTSTPPLVEGLVVEGRAVEGRAEGAAVGRPSKARVPTEAADSNGSLALI